MFHLPETTREHSACASGPIPEEFSQLEELSQLFLADNELDGTHGYRVVVAADQLMLSLFVLN